MTDLMPSPSKRPKRSKQHVSTADQNGYSVTLKQAHLSSLCGCGKCTVSTFLQRGCPKPSSLLLDTLPHLDVEGLSESHQLIRKGRLYLEYTQLCDLFTMLESSVLKSLTDRRVPVESVFQLLQSISAFIPPHTHTPLLAHQLSALKEAKTHSQFSKFISSLSSFFNCSLLEQLVDKLGSDSDKTELEKYKAHFNEYAKRNLFECPSFHPHTLQKSSEFCELVIKVDKDFSKLSVSHLSGFMDWLSTFLMVTRASIQLVSVSKRESCHVEMVYPQLSKEVELVCRLSTVVWEEVLPFSPEQEEMLKAAGIQEVHCGDVHQVLVTVAQSSAALPISEHPGAEYFNNLTIAQATMLLNPPQTIQDQVSRPAKNGHAHEALLRGPGYRESYMPVTSSVPYTQSDLASQFLTSRADGPGNSSRDEHPSAEGPGSEVSDSEEDADKPKPKPAPGKKTRGRVKIPMKYIKNKLRRYTTFSKRKSNIMKKAYELSTLTGTQVMLMVASETGHVYTFATPKLQPMITSEAGKALIQTCLHQPDPPPSSMTTPTSSAEQFDVRMSSAGYEEVELGAYKLGSDEQKSDKAPPTSLSSLLPLPSSFQSDIASLMPVLSSLRPPLSLASPDYSHMKGDGDGKE